MTLEERLDNWGRVVRSPKYQRGVCSLWAKWYVALRTPRGDDEPNVKIPVEDRDAWEVERAWSLMPAHTPKWLLKYHYVWGMSLDQTRIRMAKTHGVRLHKSQMEVLMCDARSRLSRELIRMTSHKVIDTRAIFVVNPGEGSYNPSQMTDCRFERALTPG
jgi:hypothetical protein